MKEFIKRHNSAIASTVTSVVSIILAVLANQLYTWLSGTVNSETSAPARVFFFITLLVLTGILIFVFSLLAEKIKEKIWPERMDDQYMKHAFLHIKKMGGNRQKSFQENQKILKSQKPTEFVIHEAFENMQLIVESCYNFFDSAFSRTGELVDDIKFESTFMTKSYIDGKITIPCSANKENRTPTSMLLRQQDSDIFANTETAKIYQMPRPKMILVEDTSADKSYAETYSDQKSRIKSSVILPVLSHKNELLGTLVVHCNQAGFFKMERRDFWNELLEMFSVELGYQKLLLDYYIEEYSDAHKPF